MGERKFRVATIDADFISKKGGLNQAVTNFEKAMCNDGNEIIRFSPYSGLDSPNLTHIQVLDSFKRGFESIEAYSPVLTQGELYKVLLFAKRVADEIEEYQDKIDVFTGTDWPCGPVVEEISKRKEQGKIKKTLGTLGVIHNGYYQGKGPNGENLLEKLINFSDEVGTVGETFCDEWENYKFHPKMPEGKTLYALPNGMRLEVTPNMPQLKDRFSYEKKNIPTIVFFSRPTKEKGLDSILGALPEISEKFQVVFMGTDESLGYHNEHVKRWINQNCKNKPDWIDWKSEEGVSEILQKAVAILSPSGYAPFERCPRKGILNGAFPIITNIGSHKDGFQDISQRNGNAIMINCKGLNGESWKNQRNVLDLGMRIIDATNRFHDMLTTSKGIQKLQSGIDSTINQYQEGKLWSMKKCIDAYTKCYERMLSK